MTASGFCTGKQADVERAAKPGENLEIDGGGWL